MLTSSSINPKSLHPHPLNASIYGSDEDYLELVELIRSSGWLKPLVITKDNVIISGHRRCQAAIELGRETVPVEVREFENELAELEALLLENASRFKTTEQKVREALMWRSLEESKAKFRMIATQNNNTGRAASENFRQLRQGKTSDTLAARVGLGSGRNYEKASRVVEQIDADLEQGNVETARGLRQVLNAQSVDAAYQLLKKPVKNRQLLLRLIASKEAKTTKQARALLKRQAADTEVTEGANKEGLTAGDWVEVNDQCQRLVAYIGTRGQIDQIFGVEPEISVNLGHDKIRFYPHELTLVTKAPPPSLFKKGDLVLIDIDRTEVADPQERKWNGFWGEVTQIGETGSIVVNVGVQPLRLFGRDLKPLDASSDQLRDVATRVLRLRLLVLEEMEEKMLDVLQTRDWFTTKQLLYLEAIERVNAYQLQPSQNRLSPKSGRVGEGDV